MPDTPAFDAYLDGHGAIVLSGEIDVMTVPDLRRVLLGALDQAVGRLVVDLAGVDFIDATGVGALVDAANKARESGGRLVVRRPSRMVRRVMDILGPDWPFETI